ncbi:hypothetical protein D9M68_870400 [compost metagenome]
MNGLSIADFLTKITSEGQGTCSLCTLLPRLEPRSPVVQWPLLPMWRRQTPASSSRVARTGREEPNMMMTPMRVT